ncbi:MAG TPA: hypothetical protein VFB38_02300 [Chthonomonadaceae bacterium]|nr:hypothetical protein [Chthonomonadaceae bacterium]
MDTEKKPNAVPEAEQETPRPMLPMELAGPDDPIFTEGCTVFLPLGQQPDREDTSSTSKPPMPLLPMEHLPPDDPIFSEGVSVFTRPNLPPSTENSAGATPIRKAVKPEDVSQENWDKYQGWLRDLLQPEEA